MLFDVISILNNFREPNEQSLVELLTDFSKTIQQYDYHDIKISTIHIKKNARLPVHDAVRQRISIHTLYIRQTPNRDNCNPRTNYPPRRL